MKLTANALASERNGRVVFSDLSFTVAAGELAELRGANGSGKTTLLRLLAGLVPLSAGSLAITPATADDLPRLCHYVGHHDALKSAVSVRDNLTFWSTMLGGEDVAAALQKFNLAALADDPVQLLSAGQRRRLALARVLAAPRPIWLLDEPMTALDAASQQIMATVIADHLGAGGLVLAATHGDWALKADHVISLASVS
jgi:heme exporter protein A